MEVAGRYRVTVDTPMGVRIIELNIVANGDEYCGTIQSDLNNLEMTDLKVDGNNFSFSAVLSSPTVGPVNTNWNCTVYEDTLTGKIDTAFMPLNVRGERI